MTAHVIGGDARNLPLPDASVDLIVTSPPYYGLRAYAPGGDGVPIGEESSPREYLAALLACTAEMARVLKPSGSVFVNLGDRYAGGGGGGAGSADGATSRAERPARAHGGQVPAKSLHLLPERYRIACTDELGLIARAVIVWAKPNGLPESVTDRVRRAHEEWVHLTRSPRYYSAVDTIREPHTGTPQRRYTPQGGRENDRRTPREHVGGRQSLAIAYSDVPTHGGNPLGKLPGSVWSIPTQPLHVPPELGVDHFAAFPFEWPRRLIRGWSPRDVCTACGEGRRPVAERASTERHNGGRSPIREYPAHHAGHDSRTLSIRPDYRIVGEVCGCPDTSASSTPGVVLDPFGGTGTTALVADVLGRTGLSVELAADYRRIATWRTTDPRERAAAAEQPRPEPVRIASGQVDLLGEG